MKLKIHKLTAKAFAPFGKLLVKPHGKADIDKGWLGYWHALEDAGFERHPVWGYLEVRRRELVLNELERHCKAPEVFIATKNVSFMAFATGGKPDDPKACPNPKTIRVFEFLPGQALIVGQGIWHTPAFPVGQSAEFLLVLERATPKRDLDIRTVGPFAIMKQSDSP